MATEKRLKLCENCLHFNVCIPYAEDVGADLDWQIRWARNCDEYADRTKYVEVVHGRWVKNKLLGCEPFYLCSVCEKIHDQEYNYCNNCGAKMDGDWDG